MASILQRRGVNTISFVNKQNYRGDRTHSNDTIHMQLAPYLKNIPPSFDSKWKTSFIHSLFHSTRKFLMDEEITSISWRFFFKSDPREFSATATFEIEENNKFHKFHMVPWPIAETSQLPWFRGKDPSHIMIYHFTPHLTSRRKDWSFYLENEYVIFFQSNFPSYNEEEILNALDY